MADGVASLTDREREVLRLLLAGHTAKSTAAELDLSVHTVNDYLREARKKLGVASSREAARILAEQEEQTPQSAPQNAAPEQIGIADTTPATDNPLPSATRDRRNRVTWIIGAGHPGTPATRRSRQPQPQGHRVTAGTVETVVLAKSGGNWGVVGYFIR
jgi:DNA-binding CsgD family transcriptional regulator